MRDDECPNCGDINGTGDFCKPIANETPCAIQYLQGNGRIKRGRKKINPDLGFDGTSTPCPKCARTSTYRKTQISGQRTLYICVWCCDEVNEGNFTVHDITGEVVALTDPWVPEHEKREQQKKKVLAKTQYLPGFDAELSKCDAGMVA